MEMLCPECRGALTTSDGQIARCSLHGGEYQILFTRHLSPPAPPPLPVSKPAVAEPGDGGAPPVIHCHQHPQAPAVYHCRQCGVALCATCAFTEPGGTAQCINCVSRPAAAGPATLPPPMVQTVPSGVKCAFHPNLQATQQCKLCKGYICPTCDFEMPGGFHLCPKCATTPQTKLSAKRKLMLVGSFVLAVWCTAVLTMLMTGMLASFAETRSQQDVLGIILAFVLLVPSVAGLALGASTIDRRLHNPPVVWVATIWNVLIVVGYLLLCVIGTFS